jgi:hypothetical protein
MQLILAIDGDPRRSEQLANLVHARLQADLVQATSAGEGLHALKDRVPDLILTSPLLSPFDEGVLDEYLRDLGAAATHVQTVRIPMLSSGPRKKSAAKRLFSLGRKKTPTSSAAPDGCDPKIFADEIAHYLTRSLEGRSASAKATADEAESVVSPAVARAGHSEPAAQSLDQWGPPAAVVQAFHETAPVTLVSAVEPTIEPTIEPMYMPGSILDLRLASPKPRGEGGTPVVRTAERNAVVEPERFIELPESVVEPTTYALIEPEPFDITQGKPFDFVYAEPLESAQSEPFDVAPGPMFIESEPVRLIEPQPPMFVEPEPTSFVAPEPETFVEPEPTSAVLSTPKPAVAAAPAPSNSASFEAALAAIRAAWTKPGQTTTAPVGPATPAGPARPLAGSAAPARPVAGSADPARSVAGSGEVDLTNEIDALEDVAGVDGSTPNDDDASDDSNANVRPKVEKPRKRMEKPHIRKAAGPEDRDEWGVLDPNQYDFSALVNKLDEVTDSDEVATRVTNGQ